MGIFSFVKPGKQIFKTIKSVKPSKNIKEFTKHKEDVAKSTEKYTKGLTEEGKINVRKGTSRVLSKISKILKREKKMGGGMMGRRMGYKGGSKKSSLGMQSVKYGLDNNPNITAADPKAKFIAAANKKKKKVI
jgi:hypothetical protein